MSAHRHFDESKKTYERMHTKERVREMDIWTQLSEMMVAVTFAEADDADTAREIMLQSKAKKICKHNAKQCQGEKRVDKVVVSSGKTISVGCRGRI